MSAYASYTGAFCTTDLIRNKLFITAALTVFHFILAAIFDLQAMTD